MSLAKHIDPEHLLKSINAKHHGKHIHTATTESVYSGRYGIEDVPTYVIPSKGVDSRAAYQIIHDELTLDGNPTLNCASFVNTYMPPEATQLYMENVSKNLIDEDEYPATQHIHQRCISMLARLWHAPNGSKAIGTACTGSSEGAQLGGLAMKRLWQERMKKAGKDIHNPGPNIVMGANAQVALEKFARYFEVEARLVPLDENNVCMNPEKAMQYVDENTIGVYVILGSTYTGHYENVKEMAKLLDEYEVKTGISIPIHVDGASGAFVAPFAHPKQEWDFSIPRVVSINTSGHKFGLCYVGVGWVVWRDHAHLPKDLIFELHYLGNIEYSFSLNFSRPAAPIISQLFNFINLGFEGYRNVALQDLRNARALSKALEATKYFTVISEIHKTIKGAEDDDDIESYVPGLPVVAFRLCDEFKKNYPHVKQPNVSTMLRVRGWIVPNYELAPDMQQVEILRVVVRESMNKNLVRRLVVDLMDVTEHLRDDPDHKIETILHKAHPKPETHQTALEGVSKTTTYARNC